MEQLKNHLNNIKEKIQNFTSRSKNDFVNLWMKLALLYQRAIANKKKILIGLIATVALVGVGVSVFYLLRWWRFRNESPTFSAIRKGELVGTSLGVKKPVWLGNLRITLFSVADGTYRPLELDEAGRRITKGYFGADIEVYNSDHSITESLLYGLKDDLGNKYERDFSIEFYLDGIKDLGVAKNYVPQTLRRGYLLFPPINEKAKKLELTVLSEVQNKKINFEIER